VTHPDLPTIDEELQAAAAAMVAQLGDLGITDAGIAARLAKTLTAKGYTPDFLPGPGQGSSMDEIFSELDSSDRIALGDLIAERDPSTAGDIWPKWLNSALESVENADRITALRQTFNTAINDAVAAVAAVGRIHNTLIEEFDVELAESRDGDMFETYLKKAELALRTAAAVNPVKEL
jgi:hypothetical protein